MTSFLTYCYLLTIPTGGTSVLLHLTLLTTCTATLSPHSPSSASATFSFRQTFEYIEHLLCIKFLCRAHDCILRRRRRRREFLYCFLPPLRRLQMKLRKGR